MSRREETLSPEYFDSMYKVAADPWQFATSDYERQKYAATLALLRPKSYSSVLEVGCSIGVFTAQLAPRCSSLLAIDASELALKSARQRVGDPHVVFEKRMVPAEFPKGQFDLIILSEVLYYLTASDLERTTMLCADALTANGHVILCHWLGETDYPLDGSVASDLFAREIAKRLPRRRIVHDQIYRLEEFSL